MPDESLSPPATTTSLGTSTPFVDTSPQWMRWLIRVRAYFRKEINELRRQPLLILALVGGPLIVLVLFGASFQSSNPSLRTAIVLPAGGVPGISPDDIARLAGTNFTITEITEDQASAEAKLRDGQIDVVQVLPSDVLGAVQRGESPEILFQSNAINPMIEGWVQYLGYAEVNEINKEFLKRQTASAQQQASTVRVKVADARGKVDTLEGKLGPQQIAATRNSIVELQQVLGDLEQQLPPQGVIPGVGQDVADLRASLIKTQGDLASLQHSIDDGTINDRINEVKTTAQELAQIEGVLNVFVETPPDVVVSPVRQTYQNVRGSAYSAVIFYAPGVLALLVQHTAITLGALALVRERLMGAFEVFRVAPVHMSQLIFGKYLGYTLFILLASVLLVLALWAFGVPLLGSIWQFALLMLLLTIASLGIGFVISAVSKSDSQAIQLAMITLLLSIFFSGFFIALDSFARWALGVSFIIPMTHGIAGFRRIMLLGLSPEPLTWISLILIALVSFVLVLILTRRQLSKA